jgi:hypothetical protein
MTVGSRVDHFDSANREIDGKAVRIVIEGMRVFEDRVDQSIKNVNERESVYRVVKVFTLGPRPLQGTSRQLAYRSRRTRRPR